MTNGQRTWPARLPVWAAVFLLAAAGRAAEPPAGAEKPPADSLRVEGGLISGQAGEKGDVRAYKGIPFAAPPVGELRWKPPQPVKPWDGVRACTAFDNWCPQPKPMLGRELGSLSEDCLYLNVWTPAKKPEDKLPVMVWIHGGGYTTGSGGTKYYDGAMLAREGVVVVTINYRLGPFGFLCHPLLSKESEKGLSGNYGMLDQIAALQWVRGNIAAFGGDPGCVTIFGESAGSASVCRLMVSPLAKGLFHRAIAESGGAHGRNRGLRETREGTEPGEKLGEAIAKALGCDQAPDVLAALRAKSADEILAASNPSQGLFGKGNKFGPVVDGWVLPDDPGLMWEQGKQHAAPFMAGTNANEGTVFLQQLPIKKPLGYKLVVRSMFKGVGDELLKLFPAETDEEVPKALDRLVTAASFVAPARMLVRAMPLVKQPAYLYQFTRLPELTRARKLGCCHALEIAYVFGNLPRELGYNEKDEALSKVMRGYWTRFARTGDPNGEGLPAWPAYAQEKDEHLELGDEIKVKSGLFKEACDILERNVHNRRGKADGAKDAAPEVPPPGF